jgi:DNA sulfur modification protein DndC
LVENRNISEFRSTTRRNGQDAVDATGHNMGNYTFAYRVQMLRELLQVQKEIQKTKPHIDLINSQELIAIQVMWYRDGEFNITVNQIYSEVFGYNVSTENFGLQERLLLEKTCNGNPKDFHLIQELLALQKSKGLLMKNYGLQNDLESHLDLFIKNNYAN